MTLEDEELTRLTEAATAARGRYTALGLLNVICSANSVQGLTREKQAEVAAAEAACEAADEALAGFQISQRWAPRSD